MRNLSEEYDYGHLDFPRMQRGNLGLQMFTTVTKSPSGQNYELNSSDASDNITLLVMAQRWPSATWTSLAERALFQADKLHYLAAHDPDNLMLVRSRIDLAEFLQRRQSNSTLIGGLLGTEGSHALDGDLENIQRLFNRGFRMMSLQHFFDNKLGGSLHGTSGEGLTQFGRDAVTEMLRLGIMLDVSHSSEQVVRDTLALSDKPLIVSHTGFQGHCDSPRNISDELMEQIAAAGGLIAVGFWDGAICGNSPATVAEAIVYGIGLVGEDHVSLGSDFDGTVTTSFDGSEMAVITQALLDANLSEQQIRKVMGENMLVYLQTYLP
jgi:microsomal dipeptidase-like Zn-dependent dipeptidase